MARVTKRVQHCISEWLWNGLHTDEMAIFESVNHNKDGEYTLEEVEQAKMWILKKHQNVLWM
jgi:hypothetical protein